MAQMSDKSRWAAGPSAPRPIAGPRKLAKRDLLAILAGAAAIAGIGVAVWQADEAREGVSLQRERAASGGSADMTPLDGWQATPGDQLSVPIDLVPAAGPADPSLVASTPAQHDYQTRAFTQILSPRSQNGAVIGYVLGEGTPPAIFARAGLKAGDVITAVNGLGFTSQVVVNELSQELAGSKVGEFVVERDGRPMTLTVRIAR